MNDTPLTEQVAQALATFDAAHRSAEDAAAAYFESKRVVGGNEAERKAAKAANDPDDYAAMVEVNAVNERNYKAAAAHLERVEKNLNVLRELLQRETAEVNRDAATAMLNAARLSRESAEAADKTAQRYAVIQFSRTAAAARTNSTEDEGVPF